jgi:hypothetical protein
MEKFEIRNGMLHLNNKDGTFYRCAEVDAEIELLRLRWTRLGALVEFGEWGIRFDSNGEKEQWIDDGVELTELIDSEAVAAEARTSSNRHKPMLYPAWAPETLSLAYPQGDCGAMR